MEVSGFRVFRGSGLHPNRLEHLKYHLGGMKHYSYVRTLHG